MTLKHKTGNSLICALVLMLSVLHINSYASAEVDSLHQLLGKDISNDQKISTTKKLAELHFEHANYADALSSYKELLILLENTTNKKGQIDCLHKLGRIYMEVSESEKSLMYLNSALNLLNEDDEILRSSITTDIGVLYEQLGIFDKALFYLIEASKINSSSADAQPKDKASTLSNIGVVYARMNVLDSAVYFFNEAKLALGEGEYGFLGGIYNNIGAIFYKKNDLDSASFYYHLSHDAFIKCSDIKGIATSLMNLAQIDLINHDYNTAKIKLDSAYNSYLKIGSIYYLRDLYLNYHDLFKAQKKYDSALEFFTKYAEVNDSINNSEKVTAIANLQLKNVLLLKDNELEALEREKELKESRNIILGTLLILLVLVAILVISRMRIKLSNSSLRNQVLTKEKLLLKQELTYKRQELENFALHILQKNEMFTEIQDTIKKVKSSNEDSTREIVKDLSLKINQNLRTTKEVEIFQNRVNEVNSIYFNDLKAKFPMLTPKEMKLCALIKLNLSSKEIALLNNITERSVIMARYRLRKKLGIMHDENLASFLNDLESSL